MNFIAMTALTVLALVLGMIALYLLGGRLGQRLKAGDDDKGNSAAETAVFSLLGLLLGFTFFGAASRLEDRRHLVTQEANDIGTAWLRLDMLPADSQPALRALFRDYTSARIAAFADVDNIPATAAALQQTADLQGRIWQSAVAAVRSPEAPPQAAVLVLPALNAMIDITTTRAVATENHPPPVIYAMLAVFGLAAALLTGFGNRSRGARAWFNIGLFAFVVSVTLAVIIDLEVPRRGLIRVDAVDHTLVEVRRGMGP